MVTLATPDSVFIKAFENPDRILFFLGASVALKRELAAGGIKKGEIPIVLSIFKFEISTVPL